MHFFFNFSNIASSHNKVRQPSNNYFYMAKKKERIDPMPQLVFVNLQTKFMFLEVKILTALCRTTTPLKFPLLF